jgi:colicin import membrane protein
MNAVSDQERKTVPKKRSDFWVAFGFALLANLAFLALIVFSVSWRNPLTTPMSVELYVPIPELPAPQLPPKEPDPIPEPPPQVKPPESPKPDIALEEERKKREKDRLEKERLEKEKREKAEREKKAREEKARLEKEKREREERERKAREEKERKEAEEKKKSAEKEFQEYLRQQARDNALQRWTAQIQIKVRGNVNLPLNLTGNPEAIFEVTLLPTGEVLNIRLTKSSGNASYDDAVSRAILKSSPLPLPERKDIFVRQLILNFRPHD